MAGRPDESRAPDDLLLHARHLLERHLETEVAARHHDALRDLEDGREVAHGGRSLDLCDERDHAAGRIHDVAGRGHVLGGLDKAQRDEVDAQLKPEPQVGGILRRSRQTQATRPLVR